MEAGDPAFRRKNILLQSLKISIKIAEIWGNDGLSMDSNQCHAHHIVPHRRCGPSAIHRLGGSKKKWWCPLIDSLSSLPSIPFALKLRRSKLNFLPHCIASTRLLEETSSSINGRLQRLRSFHQAPSLPLSTSCWLVAGRFDISFIFQSQDQSIPSQPPFRITPFLRANLTSRSRLPVILDRLLGGRLVINLPRHPFVPRLDNHPSTDRAPVPSILRALALSVNHPSSMRTRLSRG